MQQEEKTVKPEEISLKQAANELYAITRLVPMLADDSDFLKECYARLITFIDAHQEKTDDNGNT